MEARLTRLAGVSDIKMMGFIVVVLAVAGGTRNPGT
jgi:hypothetical protein